ncbi:MAG: hypothetical protein Q4E41_08230 [Bacteroidales bacterium]|nr:hypothetical protein [Bacteroidales bacterium]
MDCRIGVNLRMGEFIIGKIRHFFTLILQKIAPFCESVKSFAPNFAISINKSGIFAIQLEMISMVLSRLFGGMSLFVGAVCAPFQGGVTQGFLHCGFYSNDNPLILLNITKYMVHAREEQCAPVLGCGRDSKK